MSLILYNYVWLYLFIIRLYHLFYPPVLINIYSAEYIAYTYILFTDRKFKIIDIKSKVGTVQIVCLCRWIKGVYTAVAFILCMHILYKAFFIDLYAPRYVLNWYIQFGAWVICCRHISTTRIIICMYDTSYLYVYACDMAVMQSKLPTCHYASDARCQRNWALL